MNIHFRDMHVVFFAHRINGAGISTIRNPKCDEGHLYRAKTCNDTVRAQCRTAEAFRGAELDPRPGHGVDVYNTDSDATTTKL